MKHSAISWSEEKQTWMWDRWKCGLPTPIGRHTAVYLHYHHGEDVRAEDLPRLEQVQEDLKRDYSSL